jgi:hypothetical protein
MNSPELHEPTPAEVAEVIRRCRLPPETQDDLGIALPELVREIRADQTILDADRRQRRRERLAAIKAFAASQRRVVDVVETARPAGAEILRQVLGPDLGLLVSSAAFGILLGMPVHPSLSMRERESRDATSRTGPYGLLRARPGFSARRSRGTTVTNCSPPCHAGSLQGSRRSWRPSGSMSAASQRTGRDASP